MKKLGTVQSLRVLVFQSLLAMFTALALVIVSGFTGEQIEIIGVFAYLMMACIGMAAYDLPPLTESRG